MRFKNLDLNLLVVLDAVLTERSISAAAERLHRSQPAVSGLMRRLREYFQDELLVRAGREMVLTPRGEALLEEVRKFLIQIESAITQPGSFDPAQMQRNVSIITADYLIPILLAPAINALYESAPGLSFTLKPLDELAVERIQHGEADLMLVPREYGSPDLPAKELFRDDFVVVGWQHNPHLQDGISVQDYQSLKHVHLQLGHAPFRNYDTWLWETYEIQRDIQVTTLSFASVPHFLIGNDRIATLPRRIAQLHASTTEIKLVDLPFSRPSSVHVVQWHRSRDNDPGLRWITDQLASFGPASA
jgi:DNA-binding transcriptional LysR family regulator